MSDAIMWYQPSYGATYHSGQQIPVTWKSSQSTCDASFRLCTSNALSAPQRRSDDPQDSSNRRGCGTITYPTATMLKNGTCTTMLDAPAVKKEQTVVLRMQDKSGSISESPYFTLSPPGKLSAPKDTDDDNSEAPSAATNHRDSGTDSGSFPSPSSNSFSGDQTFYANAVDSLAKPNNLPLSARNTADSTFNPNIFSSSSTRPNLLSVAIPLGFMICLTVIALSLAVLHFRKRVRRQAIDTEKLANMSRWSSSDSIYKDKGQLEYPANAAIPAHISGPVPLFMPVDLDVAPEPEGKRSPRKSVPMSPSYTNVSSSSHSPKSARVSRPLTVSRESRERRNVEQEERIDDESMEL